MEIALIVIGVMTLFLMVVQIVLQAIAMGKEGGQRRRQRKTPDR